MTDWFRSWHGAPTDSKWLGVARRAKVPVATVVATVWALFDDASQNTDRGSTQHFNAEDFAAFLGIDETDVQRVVAALVERGIIDSGGRLAAWDKRQSKREDSSTLRVQAFRERQGSTGNGVKRTETHGNADVTHGNADVTHGNASETPQSTEVEGDSPSPPYRVPPLPRSGERVPRARGEKQNKNKKLPISADWEPSKQDRDYAEAEGLDAAQIGRETAAFVDWNRSKGTRSADWSASWRGWVRSAIRLEAQARGPPGARKSTHTLTPTEEALDALARIGKRAEARKAAGQSGGNRPPGKDP
jgi:hypothetical protein